MSDVQYATLEPNGMLGYTLNNLAQPATKEDVVKLAQQIDSLKQMLENNWGRDLVHPGMNQMDLNAGLSDSPDLFEEVAAANKKLTPQPDPPEHLQ